MSVQTEPKADPSPLIGQSIGKYRIIKLLGQGGMGAVFEAQHQTINQRVAIKVLHPKLTSDETSVQRFLHEARTTSLVHHPGLVKVHDFGQLPDGAAYMMMEYLEGESLKSRLSQRGKLDSKDALRITRQLAAALAAAHEKGVVHREAYRKNAHCSQWTQQNAQLPSTPPTGDSATLPSCGPSPQGQAFGRSQLSLSRES
jgi:hypothetical protein